MSAALHIQRIGRVMRGRPVHAQRARTLRRQGKDVHFSHLSVSGRAVYLYRPHPVILDYVGSLPAASPPDSWRSGPYTLEHAREDFIALRAARDRYLREDES